MNLNSTTNLNFNSKVQTIKRLSRSNINNRAIMNMPTKNTNISSKAIEKSKVINFYKNVRAKIQEGFDFLDELFRAQFKCAKEIRNNIIS